MKRFLKECFRYRLSGVAMVACLVLSMLAAYYGISIYKNMFLEYKDNTEYAYPYRTVLRCYVSDVSEFPSLPESVACNLKIIDFHMVSDNANTTNLGDIIINSRDENWPLVSGHYASREEREQGENLILIGQGLLDSAYSVGNDLYYKVFGDEYRVIGVLGTKESVTFDYKLVLYLDCLGEHTQERIFRESQSGFFLSLESNTTDTEQIYHQYMEGQYPITMEHYETYSNASAAPIYNEKSFCIIIYLFCFFCIGIVIRFWLMQRKHEMQICRAFGYTNQKILLRLLNSFSRILLFSFGIFVVFCLGINQLIRQVVEEYRLEFSWYIILPYIFLFLLSVFIVSGKALYRFLHKSIVENL